MLVSEVERMIITERILQGRNILPDKILDELRMDIISQKYAAGERIIEENLSRQYGVSRGSVRSALKELETEGLIRILSNGRKEVVGFSKKQASEVYDLRWLLENHALNIILQSDDIRLSPMINALERMEEPDIDDEEVDCFAADIQFHQALMVSCGNRPLIKAWETNMNTMYALMKLYMVQSFDGYKTGLHAQHKEIFQLIAARDNQVIDVLKEHIMSACPY